MMPFIEWAIKASLLALVALVAAACARRRSAALRHALLAAGVVSALGLPGLFLVSPGWEVPAAHVPLVTGRAPGVGPLARPAGARGAETSPPDVQEQTSPASAAVAVVMGVVVAGATVSLLLLAIGLGRLARLARAATAAPAECQAMCDEAAGRLGVRRAVRLVFSSQAVLPITWGHWRPCVLLPAEARQWNDNRSRVVLLHELAHVARGDWRLHVCAEVLRSVFWFNPLMWILCRRLRRESEASCDDRVLQAGVEPADYASHLVELARACRASRQTPLPAPAIIETSSLEGRVRAMLNPHIDRAPVARQARLGVLLAAAAIAISVAGGSAAQSFATFAGSVVDPQNAVLPGVTFTLTQLPDGARYEVKSNREGRVELPGLQPGVYDIQVSLPGFSTLRSRMQLQDGERLEPQLMLQVGEIEETVTVTDDPASLPRRQFLSAPDVPRCPGVPPSADGVAIGGNILPPKRTVNVSPVYPAGLSGSGRSAVVELEAQIGLDGRIEDVRPAAGSDPDFAAAAMEAVRQWEWTPTLLNCQPVAIHAKVHVHFSGVAR